MYQENEDSDPLDSLATLFADFSVDLPDNWQAKANCKGVNPNLFFPERGVSTSEAKAVCNGCEVKEECLEFAVAGGEKFGIWGGYSERERRKIRRARRVKSQEYGREYEESQYQEKKATG